jgi:hypothetical protein
METPRDELLRRVERLPGDRRLASSEPHIQAILDRFSIQPVGSDYTKYDYTKYDYVKYDYTKYDPGAPQARHTSPSRKPRSLSD